MDNVKVSYNRENTTGNAKDSGNNLIRFITPNIMLNDFKHIVTSLNDDGEVKAYYVTGLYSRYDEIKNWRELVKDLDRQIDALADRTDKEKELLHDTLHEFHGFKDDIMLFLVDKMVDKLAIEYLTSGNNVTT